MSKKEKNIQRKNERERLTNQFMIQMSYAVLGIVLLYVVQSLYKNMTTILYMYYINWIVFGLFTVAAVIFIWAGLAKKSTRLKNYGCMFVGCSLVALWLSLYTHVRPGLQDFLIKITGNQDLNIYSYWQTRLPMIAIVVYIVVAFIIYCIRVAKK